MGRFIFYSLFFIFGVILQFGWSQFLQFYGLAPNFLIIFIIFISLLRGPMIGQLLGFSWGLSWDVLSVDLFGSYTFIFTCIGYFIGKLSKKWNESKAVTQMLLVLISSIMFWVLLNLLYTIFAPEEFAFKINYIVIWQPVLNMLIAPIIFKFCNLVIDYFDIYSSRH